MTTFCREEWSLKMFTSGWNKPQNFCLFWLRWRNTKTRHTSQIFLPLPSDGRLCVRQRNKLKVCGFKVGKYWYPSSGSVFVGDLISGRSVSGSDIDTFRWSSLSCTRTKAGLLSCFLPSSSSSTENFKSRSISYFSADEWWSRAQLHCHAPGWTPPP